MVDPASTQPPDSARIPAYLMEALEDAERLLKYAAEVGIDIDAETRLAVLHARSLSPEGWTEDVESRLLVALTRLTATLKPVTAASLKAYLSETRPTMRTYLVWAIILSIVIIPLSMFTFVTSSISDALRADITKANALAVKLSAEVGPSLPTGVGLRDVIADLQDYASTVRLIFARSERLDGFVPFKVAIPPALKPPMGTASESKERFELPIPLELDNAAKARDDLTKTYQDVRFYAQSIVTDGATFYATINSCFLPILYALLGTCAYLLRSFEDQMSNRTFIPSAANSARFLIAAIGGTVIGLFSGFTSQASASPLAVAFLVGYAVEVFFTFLEGLIKGFTRSPTASSAVHAVVSREGA
jgi:hypothetical protein